MPSLNHVSIRQHTSAYVSIRPLKCTESCRECRRLTNDRKRGYFPTLVSQLAQQKIPKSGIEHIGLIPVSDGINHCMLPTYATSYAYACNRISPKPFLVSTLIRSKESREPVPMQYKNTTLHPRSASTMLTYADAR
jgi:hypothetical protein